MSFFGRQKHPDPFDPLRVLLFKKTSDVDFFGIDDVYIVEVEMKEMFLLIQHGFNDFYLETMPISRRRKYFELLVKSRESGKEDPNKPIVHPDKINDKNKLIKNEDKISWPGSERKR